MTKLFQPYVSWRAVWNVVRVLRSGYLAEGKEVKLFEQEFGKKFKKTNVVAVNSGTSALELAYELAGLKKGDEVITPVFTCTATNLPLLHRNVKIVFADIDLDLNIDVHDTEKKISKKTKALVFVHIGGNNRGLDGILRLGRRYRIPVIEDAAQAVGSSYWGKADFTAVSLQAVKTLTSGDGGFLICKNKKDYEKARRLRWFGYDREEKQKTGNSKVKEAGYKYHMNDISAAIGRGNLASIDEIISHREILRGIYIESGICAGTWFASVIARDRNSMQKDLNKIGVPSGQYHFRNDMYDVFKKYASKVPNMDYVEDKYLLLPLHHGISAGLCRKICETVHG